jgi:hypothetical protein
MFWRARDKYVMLQDLMPIEEQWAIERAVVQVMPAEAPSQRFVVQLSEDLLVEARRQQAARQKNTGQVLRLLGYLGGGLLPVIGGILILLLVNRKDERTPLMDALRGSAPSDLALSGA